MVLISLCIKRRNKGGALICKYPNIWAPRRLFIHDYITRNRNILRLSLCNQKLGKQGVCYHSLTDWNNLDKDIRNAPDIVNFKRSIFSRFLFNGFCISIVAFDQFLS